MNRAALIIETVSDSERKQQRFKSAGSAQGFLSMQAPLLRWSQCGKPLMLVASDAAPSWRR